MANILQNLGSSLWSASTLGKSQQRGEAHKAKMAQMEELLKTQKGRTLLLKAQGVALEQGRSIYGTRGRSSATTDPMTKAAVDIGNIAKARESFKGDITDETAAFFDAAEKSVKDKVGYKEPVINPKTGKPRRIFDKSGKVIGTRNVEGTATTPEGKVVDNRALFSEGVSPFGPATGDVTSYDIDTRKPRTIATEKGAKPLEDYFQAGTETVPEENIPRTFEQLGIADTEDMATFQEMQDALPERDLKLEFENDPEGMQRLIKLWREKKLNKKNIRKAFSMIQAKARQSLGIA